MSAATKTERLYKTRTALKRIVHVSYPVGKGRLILRTEQDWNRDIKPIAISEDGNTFTFRLQTKQPFLCGRPGVGQ
jgi:hypothetical protein